MAAGRSGGVAGVRRLGRPALAAVLAVAVWATAASAGGLSAPLEKLLRESKYVYIATQRKDQSFGRKAEIWFMFHAGAVWVASSPQSWRARRIKAGRPAAKIYVGKADGPSFDAKGAFVKDAKVRELMFRTYAQKYPEGWPEYESRFRDGLADGSRVMIKYVPGG